MRPKKKIKSTTCKFYNKWDLKVSFSHCELNVFRHLTLSEIQNSEKSSEFVKNLAAVLNQQLQGSYLKRVESKILDIYTNDQSLFDYFLDKFDEHIKNAYKIDECNKNLLDLPYTVVAKHLPHKKYQFKVFLQPHKIKNKDEKQRYLQWLDTQSPRIKISESVKSWFYNTQWNWDRRYVYVDDEKTLLLMKLRMPESIGTVYNYVLSGK